MMTTSSEQRQTARQRWLENVTGPYLHRGQICSDVERVLDGITTLSPKTDVFTHDDGRAQLLLCLFGTLPISFAGSTYHAPIEFWLPYDYPRQSPIVYLVPTSNMMIRPTNDVDPNGRCTPEYLRAWESKSEGSNLFVLCQTLQTIFGQRPPLWNRRSAEDASVPVNRHIPQTSGTSHSPPPLPAKPAEHVPPSQDSLRLRSLQSRQAPQPMSPPLQVVPPSTSQMPSPQSSSMPPRNMQPNFYPNQSVFQPVAPQLTGPTNQFTSPNGLVEHAGPAAPQVPRVDPAFSSPPASTNSAISQNTASQCAPLTTTLAQGLQSASTLVERTRVPKPPNLLDAQNDAEITVPVSVAHFPTRPPNPELLALRARLCDRLGNAMDSLRASTISSVQGLTTMQADLAKGEPAIVDEIGRLNAVKAVCEGVLDRYADVCDSVETNLNEVNSRGETEVDELVCSTTIVYNQLFDLVAEDNAIEDTIYHLGRGLNAGTARLDLDKFLKRVRALAMEQFTKRALINKILLEVAVSRASHGNPSASDSKPAAN